MWKQLLNALKSTVRSRPSTAPTVFYVYQVAGPEGERALVSLFPEGNEFGLLEDAIVGECISFLQGEPITEANFRPNPAFVKLLHGVVARHAPQLPGLREAAQQQNSGWIYVIDGRTPNPQGNVPAWDIIGAFEVHGGHVSANSYQPNTNHKLFSRDGLFRLEPALLERLMEQVNERVVASLHRSALEKLHGSTTP